jgi:hypothetical protein
MCSPRSRIPPAKAAGLVRAKDAGAGGTLLAAFVDMKPLTASPRVIPCSAQRALNRLNDGPSTLRIVTSIPLTQAYLFALIYLSYKQNEYAFAKYKVLLGCGR